MPPPSSSSISGFNFQKLFIVQCVRNEDSQESRRTKSRRTKSESRLGIIKVPSLVTRFDQLYYTILLVRKPPCLSPPRVIALKKRITVGPLPVLSSECESGSLVRSHTRSRLHTWQDSRV